MATSIHTTKNRAEVESEQIINHVTAESGNTGTAMALAQAVEETDDELYGIMQKTDLGKKKVTVWCKFGDKGEESGVPEPLHDLLTEWGYHHVGEDGMADYHHTESWSDHVYLKD